MHATLTSGFLLCIFILDTDVNADFVFTKENAASYIGAVAFNVRGT